MVTIVKICGLSTPDTMAAALDSGADMIGLVFFAKSPRYVDLKTARALAEQARGRAAIATLTVNADDATLTGIIAATRPDILQLHGHETAERIADIRLRFRRPVMKAVGIASAEDVTAARDLAVALAAAGSQDRMLLDAKPPKDAALPGGNGLPFDRNLVAGLDLALPFMVSGGLDPASVAEAIRLVAPWGVDVSSGVERAPGVKDPARIEAFIRAARAAGVDGGETRGRVA
ncbi:MAG: phosphoribosylanthranilate isomerase [Chelatococcus sp.]|uniref:phosphoribosylanthranilate isomerase n=1 Tax=Chelatococcus sp. TaxID=1953771 RepID=UPI0025BA5C28|nr:phosphoribosylanthranilate isomerase [Chelatococcus sp.]MBX3537259.1 phosphoribosylanthranilate isomerase [Chelatococcus sp.]